ncbi:F-box domain protein [Aspergillus steynii IBT 23096]|uniref:F-box domain protein n=1 Tax=Aspergillus steynii IBT 23096 TaxID=1392250 RepID=A0A2I2G3M5_9EURO|nr:F-box domain protein [Aspergillus steynii IBT 23096]PLB47476.1 F-box domain protein [Aspergillus steynii IBT 23096]
MDASRPPPPQRKGKSPFAQLPRDCLGGILEHLALDDALSLSTSCNDLQASSVPFVLRDVSMDWTSRPRRQVLQLLQTIFKDPERASYVQHVSMMASGDPWDDTQPVGDWETERREFEDVLDQAMDLVRRAGVADADDWHLPIYGGNIYTLATVFLSQLPNLKSLRLDYSFVWWDGYPGIMLKQALLCPNGVFSTFQHLETVEYGANVPIAETHRPDDDEVPDGYPPYNPEQFMAWFCLPSLRHLNIWLRDLEGLEEARPDLDLSNLETLVMARSTATEQHMHFLLSRTPNLKGLHAALAYAWPGEAVLQDSPVFVQALEAVRPTLEKLSLGVECYPSSLGDREWNEADDPAFDPFHQFLTHFTTLRTAEVPLALLLGWYWGESAHLGPLLPSSLSHLCLRDDLRSFYDFEWSEDRAILLLESFLQDWRSHTPSLERITLRLWDQNYTGQRRDQEERLQTVASDAGVELQIVVDDLGSGLWTLDP